MTPKEVFKTKSKIAVFNNGFIIGEGNVVYHILTPANNYMKFQCLQNNGNKRTYIRFDKQITLL